MDLRPTMHLRALARDYPQAWRMMEETRRDRGRLPLPDWPDWCWVPMAGAYAVVSHHLRTPSLGMGQINDVSRLSALAAWRLTQGVYRYPPDLWTDLWSTRVTGDIPVDVLLGLPEYCVYIEVPGGPDAPGLPGVYGAYAHMEYDVAVTGRIELRLLVDHQDGFVPVPLHVQTGGVAQALESALGEILRHADALGLGAMDDFMKRGMGISRDAVRGLVSVLLHLCTSWQADARSGKGAIPAMPTPTRSKGRDHWYPPPAPAVYETGYRLADALRRVRSAGGGESHPHAGPAPHVRRAHWHGYWTGPKADPAARRLDVRWTPPIPVGFRDAGLEALIPTVRVVR